MARLPRLVLANQPHHVIQRGNNRQIIFREDEDYQRFLVLLKDSAKFYGVAIHAYVLMPNHVHLLASPGDEHALALTMQKVGRLYVPWFNKKYQRTGGLFEGRFRTSVVETARYFMICSRYIELNPVRAHLAAHPADYPWSSYLHHAGVKQDSLVSDHSLYWALGNTPFQREASYIDMVQQGISDEESAQVTLAMNKGWPLADHSFKIALERKTERRVLPGKRGRPFKVVAPATSTPEGSQPEPA
jgi:putative transposase